MKLPKFLNFRKKSCNTSRYQYYSPLMIGMHDRLVHTGNVDIAAAFSSSYYIQTQPLYDAIERIATAIGSLEPKVWDKEKEEWVEHDVLKLLQKPDDDTTWSEFFSNSGRWLMLTGNVEWIAGGNVSKPPMEVRAAHPQHVTIQRSNDDPYPSIYELNEPWGGNTFKRFPKPLERQLRYYKQDKLRELYHVKTFNPLSGSLHGLSPLNPVYYEIEQYKALSIHNLGLMKNGARAGLVIKTEQPLTPEQSDRLKTEIDQMYSGETNANRPMVLDGGMDAVDLGKNNREMDYVKLRKSILDGIYSTFRIPLPMVSADRMTLSNYAVSQLMLYDHTVEHYANRIFEELTRLLMPRYGDIEGNLLITYNPRDVSALETRRNEQVKLLADINKNTPNELRLELGFDERPEKGMDVVYNPTNMLPITDDTEDEMKEEKEEKKPAPVEDDEEANKNYIQQFKSILKSYKQNGDRMFSDKEVEKLSEGL